jgi:hypothetical protein
MAWLSLTGEDVLSKALGVKYIHNVVVELIHLMYLGGRIEMMKDEG